MSAEWRMCALDGALSRAPCRCFGSGQLRDPVAQRDPNPISHNDPKDDQVVPNLVELCPVYRF